jgi:hypothetical protein
MKKMGVLVDESNGIVFRNQPCPQINVQLVALFSILVPFGRGWLSRASCAQCWGKRRYTLRSGKKRLLGILILWGLPLSSLIVIIITPCPAITNPLLILPTCCSAWSRRRSSNRRLSFAMHREAWLSMPMGMESMSKRTQAPESSAWKAKQVALCLTGLPA